MGNVDLTEVFTLEGPAQNDPDFELKFWERLRDDEHRDREMRRAEAKWCRKAALRRPR